MLCFFKSGVIKIQKTINRYRAIVIMTLLVFISSSRFYAERGGTANLTYAATGKLSDSSGYGATARPDNLPGLAAPTDNVESSSHKPATPGSVISSSPAVNARRPSDIPEPGIEWKALTNGSLYFLGVMHSFRIATEAGTRHGLHNPVVGGYFKALGAMHGWSDGDTYYENYLGHPIQGAVSGYIWIHNDPRYRAVQFGAERDYWISRLRAYGFAWAFSEQFEIGAISEASIGQIQRYCCAYGFVDHIITPNGALVWMVAADALDRYVTVPLENRTRNTAARILARVALNPPQSFANLMIFRYPWHRENRSTVSQYDGTMYLRRSQSLYEAVDPKVGPATFDIVPKFEVTAAVPSLYQVGGLKCLGGGAVGALRATDFWQSLPQYRSGDSLTFTFGPQWIVHTAGRWSPHAHFRVGGQKITEEQVDPEKKKYVLSRMPPDDKASEYRNLFTQHWETTGLSLSLGGGLDIAVNRALALRVVNIDYTRSWLENLNGNNFEDGLRFTTGLVLRIGTW
jgi:hypothetical protein